MRIEWPSKNACRKNPQNQNYQVRGVNRIQVSSSDLAIPTPLLNQSVADRAPDAELTSAFMGAMASATDLQVNRVNLCLNSIVDDHTRWKGKAALLTGVGDVEVDVKIVGRGDIELHSIIDTGEQISLINWAKVPWLKKEDALG